MLASTNVYLLPGLSQNLDPAAFIYDTRVKNVQVLYNSRGVNAAEEPASVLRPTPQNLQVR